MHHKARDSGGKFALLLLLRRHIGLLFGKWLMVAGKKKLRIQIYPDTCGRGLSKSGDGNSNKNVAKQKV